MTPSVTRPVQMQLCMQRAVGIVGGTGGGRGGGGAAEHGAVFIGGAGGGGGGIMFNLEDVSANLPNLA
jgi:hypothetical protein